MPTFAKSLPVSALHIGAPEPNLISAGCAARVGETVSTPVRAMTPRIKGSDLVMAPAGSSAAVAQPGRANCTSHVWQNRHGRGLNRQVPHAPNAHETGECGGLAQLVERVLCKHEVSGSNPLSSTKGSRLSHSLGARTGCACFDGPIQTVLMLTNSWIPTRLSSRP